MPASFTIKSTSRHGCSMFSEDGNTLVLASELDLRYLEEIPLVSQGEHAVEGTQGAVHMRSRLSYAAPFTYAAGDDPIV